MPKKFALIVAGGSGNRMGASVPKQFLEIKGKPLLMYTFETFLGFDPEIKFVLVLPETQIDHWKKLCAKHAFVTPYKLAAGGTNRFRSVKNGLDKINDDGIVFIHDGVRPLVTKKTIESCYKQARLSGNALPVIPPSESIRFADENGNKALDRRNYFLVQTPQTFRVNFIKEAYEKAPHEDFTDDASVLESSGHKIHLVDGNRENIKITWPQDLILAESFLLSR